MDKLHSSEWDSILTSLDFEALHLLPFMHFISSQYHCIWLVSSIWPKNKQNLSLDKNGKITFLWMRQHFDEFWFLNFSFATIQAFSFPKSSFQGARSGFEPLHVGIRANNPANVLPWSSLPSRGIWRLASTQLSYCPSWTISIIYTLHEHGSLPLEQIWAFASFY